LQIEQHKDRHLLLPPLKPQNLEAKELVLDEALKMKPQVVRRNLLALLHHHLDQLQDRHLLLPPQHRQPDRQHLLRHLNHSLDRCFKLHRIVLIEVKMIQRLSSEPIDSCREKEVHLL
jgi:hypothetical protein